MEECKLTIEEIRDRKRQLENTVLGLVTKFEQDNNIKLESLVVNIESSCGMTTYSVESHLDIGL
jgi:hypothetical protein